MIALELPLALLGLLALALPVLIHAIARKTPRDFALPTLRFLDAAPRARRSFALPQDRFVLALRCLALALLAFAAARPFVPGAASPSGNETLVAILDDTMSMAHGRDLTRFTRAKLALEKMLDALPARARVALLLSSHPTGTLGSLAEAREALRDAAPTARSASLVPALEHAALLVASTPHARVVVASDFDRPSLEGIERRSEAARALRATALDVGDDPHDASLCELSAAPSPAIAGEPVTVSARLRAVGLAGPIEVALERDGREVSSQRVLPGERASFSLDAKGAFVTGALHLKDPRDELDLDDRAFFAVPIVRRIGVTLLGRESPEKGARGREQPLLDALAALAHAQGLAIDVTLAAETSLARALEGASVLLLASPRELQEDARRAISAYAGRGGGVVVLLDEDPPESTLRALAEKGALPATAKSLAAGPAAPPHLESSLGFEPPLARALAALELAPQAGVLPLRGAEPLVAAASGEPLWVERGKAVVLGFAPWGRNGALAREAAFPLLVGRAFRAALGSEGAPGVEAGEALSMADLAHLSRLPVAVVERATLAAPGTRPRPLAGETAVVPETPGIHVLLDGRPLAAFAVNASEREALLERAPESARLLLAGEDARVEREPGSQDLTALTVVAGLFCLFVASIVASRGVGGLLA